MELFKSVNGLVSGTVMAWFTRVSAAFSRVAAVPSIGFCPQRAVQVRFGQVLTAKMTQTLFFPSWRHSWGFSENGRSRLETSDETNMKTYIKVTMETRIHTKKQHFQKQTIIARHRKPPYRETWPPFACSARRIAIRSETRDRLSLALDVP